MAHSRLDIRYSEEVLRTLRRSNKRDLIRRKIEELADDPRSLRSNVTRLQGRPESRLRVQDWRVIFRIEGNILWIDKVLPRGSAYEVSG
jgi:mRNA interferase RelE/StbE